MYSNSIVNLGKKGNADSVKKGNETDVKTFGRIELNAHRVAVFAESFSNQFHLTASFDSIEASLKKELAAFPWSPTAPQA